MRLAVLAAVLLVSGAAFAGDKHDGPPPNGQGQPAPKPPVFDPRLGKAGLPTAPGNTLPGKPDHHDGKGPHRRDGRVWGEPFYPYPPLPYTWPYPPYPYSQYYYPYPPQYYPNNIYGNDDYPPPPSTRGLVVPGDLPVGATAFWYYCDAPDGYYPYVKECSHEWTRIPIAPPPPGTAAPVSYSDWQWCEEKKGFFPYVTSCLAGFAPVPVTAPGKDQAGPPQVAYWYFCDNPRGYSPYVVQCARDWRAVPAVPPPSVKITVKGEK